MKTPIALLLALSSLGTTGTLAGEWVRVSAGTEPLPWIRDLCAAGEDVFAVGESGCFCHLRDGKLTRVPSPTKERLTFVWARNGKEAYALVPKSGVVLYYDGKSLKPLGGKVPMVKRKYHPGVEPRPQRVQLISLWASSPNDVYVTGWPMALLRFDGKKWHDVDIGAQQIIVRTQTRLGRAVVSPQIGPVWGSGPDDVWVRKDVIQKSPAPKTFEERFRIRETHITTNVLMRFDGKKWRETQKTLAAETYENQGRGMHIPEVLTTAATMWARFDNALHVWDDADWRSVAKLPETKKSWNHWAASGENKAVIYSHSDGLRVFEDGKWKVIEPPPGARGVYRLALTEKGVIAACGGDRQLYVRR